MTSTIPVVMAATDDPVGLGLVQSLGHPGTNHGPEQSVGRDDRQATRAARGARAGRVGRRGDLGARERALLAGRRRRRTRARWKLLSLWVRDAGEIDAAFKAATASHAGALLVTASGALVRDARRFAELAARSRLPAMYALRLYADAGGLVSYGANLSEIWRRAAVFVDKILKGARPGDLPVEQPTKFELVINLKSAKALGFTIPPSMLSRADDVVQ